MIYTIIRSDTTTITLDCVQQFSESYSATATQHSVETGSSITDHVFLNNTELSMRGVVSDFSPSPTYITMSSLDDAPAERGSRSHTQEIKDILKRIHKGREVVTIQVSEDRVSEVEQFENCVITSLNFSDDPEAGEAIYPDIKLSQIRVVSKSTRQETAVPQELNSKVQQAQEDAKASADAANKTKVNKPVVIGALSGDELAQYAQNKAGARSIELRTMYPSLTQPEIYEQIEKETGQTLSSSGTITAGWTEKNSLGQPISNISKTVSKESLEAQREAIRDLNKKIDLDKLRGLGVRDVYFPDGSSVSLKP